MIAIINYDISRSLCYYYYYCYALSDNLDLSVVLHSSSC